MTLLLTPRSITRRPAAPNSALAIGRQQERGRRGDGVGEEGGARIVKPGQDAFWGGYHGYFQDPDGHLWEIAWNPNP